MSRSDRILTHDLGIIRTKHLAINGNNNTFVSNLFKVTGLVRVLSLVGTVETAALGSNVTDCWWDLYSTNGSSALTGTTTPAPAMTGFQVGSAIIKAEKAAEDATILQADVPMFLEEDADYKKPFKSFIVGKDAAAETLIRFMYTTNANLSTDNGIIHFEVKYEPITSGSKIEPA